MTSLFIKIDVSCCPVSAGLNFRGTKLSRMAVEPRKPRKFSTAKIKVHTVVISNDVWVRKWNLLKRVLHLSRVLWPWGLSYSAVFDDDPQG